MKQWGKPNLIKLLFTLSLAIYPFYGVFSQSEAGNCKATNFNELLQYQYSPEDNAVYIASDLQWSPDGSQLAISYLRNDASREEIRLWDWQRNLNIGLHERRFTEYVLSSSKKLWSPNGQYLAIKTDESLDVWDFGTQTLKILADDLFDVSGFAWSPDSKYVAIVVEDRVEIWDYEKGQQFQADDAQGGWYNARPVWSAVNKLRLLRRGDTREEINVWELDIFDDSPTWTLIMTTRVSESANVQLSPTGNLLAIDTQNPVEIWDINQNKLLQQLDTGSALAWSMDEECLVTGKAVYIPTQEGGQISDSLIELWSVQDGTLLFSSAELADEVKFNEIAWSPDGKHLAFVDNENVVRILELPGE